MFFIIPTQILIIRYVIVTMREKQPQSYTVEGSREANLQSINPQFQDNN